MAFSFICGSLPNIYCVNWLPTEWMATNMIGHIQLCPKIFNFLAISLGGCISWYGFMKAGLHPALGLLPIVPAIPHADRAFGFFDAARACA